MESVLTEKEGIEEHGTLHSFLPHVGWNKGKIARAY